MLKTKKKCLGKMRFGFIIYNATDARIFYSVCPWRLINFLKGND